LIEISLAENAVVSRLVLGKGGFNDVWSARWYRRQPHTQTFLIVLFDSGIVVHEEGVKLEEPIRWANTVMHQAFRRLNSACQDENLLVKP
jgi:hypothetical protein